MANTMGIQPDRLAASTRCPGISPWPAITARGRAFASVMAEPSLKVGASCARRADRAFATFTNEGDDLTDVHVVGEFVLHIGEALLQRSFRPEQNPISAPQRMDRFAAI